MELPVDAYRLVDKARELDSEERMVLNYFLENISVGALRAVKELKAKGVKNPEDIIARLVEIGLLEDKGECYNLAAPLRELVKRKGGLKL
ncbi:MAG: hypothetical protein F7B17_05500 [Desulfurococcales archaeon]|nr:hypothetical protein [Desulfurococcales archaeon]